MVRRILLGGQRTKKTTNTLKFNRGVRAMTIGGIMPQASTSAERKRNVQNLLNDRTLLGPEGIVSATLYAARGAKAGLKRNGRTIKRILKRQ